MRARLALLGIAALIGATPLAVSQAATYVWTGAGGDSKFSNPANWQGGVVPLSSSDTVIRFQTGVGTLNLQNDLAGGLTVGRIEHNGVATVILGGNTLAFAGPNPVTRATRGILAFANTVQVPTGSTLGVQTTGRGDIEFSLNNSSVTGGGNLVWQGARPYSNAWGYRTLAGALPAFSNYSGGVLSNLSASNGDSRTGSTTYESGVIQNGLTHTTSPTVFAAGNTAVLSLAFSTTQAQAQLDGGVSIVGGGNLRTALTGVGGVNLLAGTAGSSTVFSALSTYTGATQVLGTLHQENTQDPFFARQTRLELSGAGSLSGTSSLLARANSEIYLGNTSASNLTDRVADTATVRLENGGIFSVGILYNQAGQPQVWEPVRETMGALTVKGLGTLTLDGGNQVLSFASFAREQKGTLFVRTLNGAETLGGAPANGATGGFGPYGLSNIQLGANASGDLTPLLAPGASGAGAVGIVPWAMGADSSNSLLPSNLLTYDANGLRMLDDFVFPSGTSTDYFRITGSGAQTLQANVNNIVTSNTSPVTFTLPAGTTAVVNSFTARTNSAGAPTTFNGGGTLSVFSGALVANSAIVFDNTTLALGERTGYLHVGGTITFQNNASVTGSNGLVISGYAGATSTEVRFATSGAANPFTGGLYLNGNVAASFSRDDQLGASGESIYLNGGKIRRQGGTPVIAANRTVTLGAGGGAFEVGATASRMSVDATVTGDGALSKLGNGTVALSATNTYTGPTILRGGYLEVSRPGNLGVGGIIFTGGNLRFVGGGTFANDLTFLFIPGQGELPSALEVASGATVTLSGTRYGEGAYRKTGAGTLIWGGANADGAGGSFVASAGLTRVDGDASGTAFSVESGALLGGNGSVGDVTLGAGGAIAPGASIGTLTAESLLWNGGGNLAFELGANGASDRIDLLGSLSKGTVGAFSFSFTDAGIGGVPGTWTLFTFGSTDFLATDFSFTGPAVSGGRFVLSPNALVFTTASAIVVPEPSAGALLGCTLIPILLLRRTRRACYNG